MLADVACEPLREQARRNTQHGGALRAVLAPPGHRLVEGVVLLPGAGLQDPVELEGGLHDHGFHDRLVGVWVLQAMRAHVNLHLKGFSACPAP